MSFVAFQSKLERLQVHALYNFVFDNMVFSPGFDLTNDQAVTAWYQRRTSKHLLMRQPAKPMDLVKVVQYDQKQASVLFVSYLRLICICRQALKGGVPVHVEMALENNQT